VEALEAYGFLESDSGVPSVPSIESSILPSARLAASSEFDDSKVCRSQLAGVVTRLDVLPGQNVRPKETLMLLEAMNGD